MKINDKFGKGEFCPECGAPLVDNMNCWEQLGGIIAWEYDYPELLAEHFKTVACYNLQHPAQFTDEAIEGLKTALIKHLDKGLSVSEIRRRNAKLYNGNRRVLKDISKRCPVQRKWEMTISDVYIPDCPEKAAERVRKWAAAVRAELYFMPSIRPSSDLRNNYSEISEFCHKYNEPVYITKNGQGDLAVMSIETYEKLVGKFELYKLLNRGVDAMEIIL